MSEDELSPLERARRKLYGDKAPVDAPIIRPHAPAPVPSQQAGGWNTDSAPEPGGEKLSLAAKFFIGAVAFAFVAGVIAIGFLFFGGRSFSTDAVAISVESDGISVSSGDTISFFITVRNQNPTTITGAKITVDFPEGTREEGNAIQPFARYTDTLGDMAPRQEVARTVRATVFGAENQVLTVPVTVEYRVEGSNAVYLAKKEYSFTVTSSPLSLSIASASEVASGQPVALTLRVRSNATERLQNVAVSQDTTPFGFTQTSATPERVGSLYRLGDFEPGEEKTVTIQGSLAGQDKDERVFRFTAGIAPEGAVALSTPYSSREASITIASSFIAVDLAINRESGETVAVSPGQRVQGTLTWRNTLPVAVSDGEIQIRFSGDAIDARSVSASGGFYRSADSTLIFNKSTSAGLAQLGPGDSGSGSFTFTVRSAAALSGSLNPTGAITLSISGRRAGAQITETLSSTQVRTVKVASDLSYTSRVVRTVGPFTNTGPWPPVPDEETTYTVFMTAANALNSIGDGTVTMSLPLYVRYTGATSPSDGSITYNETTREVTWKLGELAASGASRQAAFQVALMPSVSQAGTSPTLVSAQRFTGFDKFTRAQVERVAPLLDIRATSDPAYQGQYGVVKK